MFNSSFSLLKLIYWPIIPFTQDKLLKLIFVKVFLCSINCCCTRSPVVDFLYIYLFILLMVVLPLVLC